MKSFTPAFLLLLFFITFSFSQNQESCVILVGEWEECVDGRQERTLSCRCDEKEESMDMCQGITRPATAQDCEVEPMCKWRWTRWTTCSRECAGGNTSRTQVCMCEGEMSAANDSLCDEFLHYGTEVAACNNFGCDEVPAYNKLYWIAKAEEGHWPMPDETFDCTMGSELNTTTPKGKHYSTVLRDDEPQTKPHPEWYYLAKEWITAKLNIANGARLTPDNIALVSTVGQLLEDCNGWTGKQLYDVYSAKEKLGRINNNIGGLEHVDEQVAVLEKRNGDYDVDMNDSRNLVLVLTIPAVAIVLVTIIVVAIVYHKRRSRYLIVEKSEFDSTDDESKEPKDVVDGERFEDENEN